MDSLEILDLFQELNDAGITLMVVTHDPEVAEVAKRELMFRDGEIVGDRVVANGIMA